jgi:hypothetical protein
MGCCIIEIAMTVVGIVILVVGKIPLTATRECHGIPARISGAIFTATLPLVLILAFGYGAVRGASDPNIMQNPAKVDELKTTGTMIEAGVTVVCLVAGLAVAFATSKPKRKPRRDVDDTYDEPFRRRPDDRDDYRDPYDDRGRERRRQRPEDEGSQQDDRIQS